MLGVESRAHEHMQGMRPQLWASLVSILSKLGTLQMEQLRNQALVILQRYITLAGHRLHTFGSYTQEHTSVPCLTYS